MADGVAMSVLSRSFIDAAKPFVATHRTHARLSKSKRDLDSFIRTR